MRTSLLRLHLQSPIAPKEPARIDALRTLETKSRGSGTGIITIFGVHGLLSIEHSTRQPSRPL